MKVADVFLPQRVSHLRVFDALAKAGLLERTPPERILFHLRPSAFVSTAAIGQIAAWGLHARSRGACVEFRGPRDPMDYLSRMDLFRCLGFEVYEEGFERHAEAGRFIPIRLVTDSDSVAAAYNAVSDLVLQQFDNAAEFLPAMEWCVCEIIDNIRLHAGSEVPGVVVAQYFPQRRRIDIAVCDAGRGIYESLAESRELWSHGDAVTQALQRGVTRNLAIGQGNGLAGSLEILRLNGGEFHVWTGDVDYCLAAGKERGFSEIPVVPGTGLSLSLDTERPVHLADTFIGDPGWSYINVEVDRVQKAGGIRIIDSCVHTGGREAALPLRRKIEAMLTEMDEPLVLDFDGVRMASSSFLDELLGRLASRLGEEALHNKLRIANATDIVRSAADVVVAQRFGRVPGRESAFP